MEIPDSLQKLVVKTESFVKKMVKNDDFDGQNRDHKSSYQKKQGIPSGSHGAGRNLIYMNF